MDRPFNDNQHLKRSTPAGTGGPSSDDIVTRSAARSALSLLEAQGSSIPDKLRQQINAQYKELLSELGHAIDDDLLVMTRDQLRGIIASAVLTGAAQVALERNVLAPGFPKEEAQSELTDNLTPALEPTA